MTDTLLDIFDILPTLSHEELSRLSTEINKYIEPEKLLHILNTLSKMTHNELYIISAETNRIMALKSSKSPVKILKNWKEKNKYRSVHYQYEYEYNELKCTLNVFDTTVMKKGPLILSRKISFNDLDKIDLNQKSYNKKHILRKIIKEKISSDMLDILFDQQNIYS
jgi:hypothetical protein